ncbi:MAG: hypothetical protein ACD_78C00091G0006 [uncultured bacterium (gcode 4)]|uniref:Uncharacterized protein n=1 Tax=uncultured bacterium (gcode 4) TaxID=1234023 RepID=K1YY35_9BACT|nr:MAG: hypothetical protein ACD_78C00091G0006 [uncultured bacterium (gcode 4)]
MEYLIIENGAIRQEIQYVKRVESLFLPDFFVIMRMLLFQEFFMQNIFLQTIVCSVYITDIIITLNKIID